MALHGWDAYRRHLSNLGFVPPEFQNHGRIVEDPDALGYTLDLSDIPDVKTLSDGQLRRAFDGVIPRSVQDNITKAAFAATGRGRPEDAEKYRRAAGYGGC